MTIEQNEQLTADRALELADYHEQAGGVVESNTFAETARYLRAFAEQQATIEDLRVCGVVTGGSQPSISNSFLGDIDVCENERPCADHPPEMIASLRSEMANKTEQLCAALAAAEGEAERRARGKPIETAPKDGREVLLCVKKRAGIPNSMLVGHFMPGGHCIEDHPAIEARLVLLGWLSRRAELPLPEVPNER